MANNIIGGCIRTPCPDAFYRWPHLPKVDHLVERKKIITNGVKPSKKTVGERKTAKSSPPGDGEVKGRKRCVRIQASTSGPPRRQRSKGQVAKSRPEPESIYPGSTGAVPGTYNARPHEPRTPMPRAPREESSDSTHFSAKRQRDRKSQLSSSMRARLGPQEPGRSRPPVATTRAPRPDPMIAPMVQNVPPHRDPMVTPAMRNVHSHLAERPAGRNLPNEPPIGSISKRLDDMLSTPFCSHITHYEPPRGFLVPKFSTYDGTNDPFDHIMHYRQLMTLDIGNDALLCKVFPASLQGQALSWFHRLPPNSVDNFRDLSEAFCGTVLMLCSTQAEYQHPPEHKNERQRILEGICETIWPSRTPNRGLQHGRCPTDLQKKHLSRHPFFESLAKKPPTTMDDLFRRANKYSMLEDDVRAATQQVLVAGRASRDNVDRHAKPPDRPKPVDRRQDGPSRPDRPPITPLSISYEKLLPMIQGLSDFSSADLVQASVIGHMGHSLAGLENPGRILSGFNGSSTTSLGDIILPVRAGPVTLNVQFSVVQELSPFNVILGRTWLHYMKAIPSTYHQMVSFLTNEGQTDLYGSQLAARQCYQIAREAVANQEDASPPEPSIAHDQ
ncbi:hypothetical protein CK203_106858 [Vitis vinifera]|uniref:Retrotransposon gag domain-containing protein n=1 Tax=Vitis vinifera TaxID=29760 RepID=A0A438CX80_VITVI|nr:hypothetical protein CK203_106858 [Vitis vinifera]